MDYRLGTCSSCNAAFRVPATFTADKAKCKSCGGVVEIGPVQSKGQSGGAKAEAPKSAPPVPARKPQPVPARKPAPKPTSEPEAPQAKAPSRPKPAAGRPARKPDSVRSAAEQAAERIRGAGTRKKAAPEAAPAGARPARATAGRDKVKGSSRARRRAPEKKRKSLAPAFIGLAILALLAVAGFYFFPRDGGSETQAAETATVDTTPVEPENGADDAMDAPVEEAPVETPEPEPEEPEPVQKKTADPDSVDLSVLEVQEKLPETSEEEFTEMKQWVATFIDPAAGAAGNRMRTKLLEKGKEAFPAIINAFIKLDVGTEQGRKNGDLIQRLLMDMCRGNNFDWKYTLEPEDVYFNKKVIVAWHYNWMLAREDPVKWAKLAKLTDEEAEAIGGKKEPELDDF